MVARMDYTSICPSIRELYRPVQQVYKNVVGARVFPTDWCTAISVFGIIHLVYESLRVFLVCVYSLWQLYGFHHQGAVQIRTADVWKCRWCQSIPHGLVNWHERFWNRTPSVRVTTGLPSLCTQPMAAVWHLSSGSCIFCCHC